MDALLDLLDQLEGFSYHKQGFSGVVLSITGFYGEERQAVRSLTALCHIPFSPSLVAGYTTHLVCSGPESAQRSNKMAQARVWGIPTLSLQWLLDSVREGCPLPVSSAYVVYLPTELPLQPPQQQQEAQQQQAQQQQQQQRASLAHHTHRPSSVASNHAPSTAAGPLGSPSPTRPALHALDNVVQQLRAVSISPAGKSQPGDQHKGSPQQSLSFQHMVGRVQSGSPAPVSSRLGAGAAAGQASPRFWPSPGLAYPGGQQGCEGPTPMCSPDGSVGSGASQAHTGNDGSPSAASDCSMEAGSAMSPPAEAWDQDGGSSPCTQVTAAGALSSGQGMQPVAESSDEEGPAQQLWAEQQQQQHHMPQRGTSDELAERSGSGLHSLELPSPATASPDPVSLAAASPARSFDEMPDGIEEQWSALGSSPQGMARMEDYASPAGGLPSKEAAAQPSEQHSGRQQQEEYKPPPQQQLNFVSDHRGGYRGACKKKGIEDWTDDETDDEFPTPPDPRTRRIAREEEGPVIIAQPAPSASALPLIADTVGVKLLQRPPRGNCVRENHGLSTLKQVQFAEQVQVAEAGLLLSTKDKKVAVKLRLGGRTLEEEEDDFQGSSTSGSAAETVLGEARTFYRLPNGSWHLEFCQLYTAQQAEQVAAERGVQLALPTGFDRTNELLKSTERQSAAISDVIGTVAVRQVKQGGTQLRLKGGGSAAPAYFWRTAFDPATAKCVTDRPVTDFVAE